MLDTEISIASVAVARERAPAAHVIVVWPDAVLAPTGTERISPWLVYELLGPSIRARTRRPKPSLEASAASEHPLAYAETLVETDAAPPTGRRVASRLTLTSVLLAALIVATMGAAFALDSLHISPALNLLRRGASSPPIAATHTSVPTPGVSHPTPDPHGSKTASLRRGSATSEGPRTPTRRAGRATIRRAPRIATNPVTGHRHIPTEAITGTESHRTPDTVSPPTATAGAPTGTAAPTGTGAQTGTGAHTGTGAPTGTGLQRERRQQQRTSARTTRRSPWTPALSAVERAWPAESLRRLRAEDPPCA